MTPDTPVVPNPSHEKLTSGEQGHLVMQIVVRRDLLDVRPILSSFFLHACYLRRVALQRDQTGGLLCSLRTAVFGLPSS